MKDKNQQLMNQSLDLAEIEHPHSCRIISKTAKAKFGISLSLHDAEYIWRDYSNQNDVDWIDLDESDLQLIENVIKNFVLDKTGQKITLLENI
ncbi:MAG: hypothetical protein HC836_44895 [Richelia sp. RM2_1_2]|nr:hypothetical protein [Richelia sp. RM2_1_2]